MKKTTSFKYLKRLFILSFLFVFVSVTPIYSAYTTTVNLADAASFAVLGGSAVTNTGTTTLTGTAGNDAGVYPGTSFTGNELIVMVGGTKYFASEQFVIDAQQSLTDAYVDAASRTPSTTIATELGGATILPGVYKSDAGTFGITGTVTLDAQDDPTSVFIFQMASTLTTADNSSFLLINGADVCNVFWQVGSSATLGVGSSFVGHIMAQDSITATTNAAIMGSLLARTGAVTLDNNTITNNLCTVIIPPVEEEEEEDEPAVVEPAVTTPSPIPDTSSPLEWILLFGMGTAILGIAGLIFKKKSH